MLFFIELLLTPQILAPCLGIWMLVALYLEGGPGPQTDPNDVHWEG